MPLRLQDLPADQRTRRREKSVSFNRQPARMSPERQSHVGVMVRFGNGGRRGQGVALPLTQDVQGPVQTLWASAPGLGGEREG
jgi:hypothetical protein